MAIDMAIGAGGMAVATALGIAGYVALARARGWLDRPNARSSHVVARPVGAGVVMTAVLLGGLVMGLWRGLPAFWGWIALPAMGLSAVGWWDDRHALPVIARLGAQGAAVVSLLVVLMLASSLPAPRGLPPWLLLPALTLGMLWFVNLFNFMDGTDGLAGSEALFVLLVLAGFNGVNGTVGAVLLVVAAAVAGFLVWNWPPARVFMGDAGSLFLGLVLAGIPGWPGEQAGVAVWCILVAAFVTDATCTLLRRAWRGERLAQAHRSHAYQRLARHWKGHGPVLLVLWGVNLIVLLPLALLAHLHPAWSGWLVGLAYGVVLVLLLPIYYSIPAN